MTPVKGFYWRRLKQDRRCEHCGRLFHVVSAASRRRFCSEVCQKGLRKVNVDECARH